jgi:hypothetical protein
LHIAVEHRQKVAGIDSLAVFALHGLQPDDVGGRHRKRQNPNCHHLEFLAHAIDLAHLPRLEIAYDRAAVRDALDDAALFQLEQRQPDIAAMGVERRAQVLLDKPLARMTPAEHDVFFELPGNHVRDRFAPVRRLGRGRNPGSCRNAAAGR